MNKRRTLTSGITAVLIISLVPLAVFAGGIGLNLSVCTVDLSGPWSQIPQAASDALAAFGVGASDAAQVLEDLNTSLSDIAEAIPIALFPVPFVGGSIEFDLPFVVIDGLRISGGVFNDALLTGLGSIVGIAIPQPIGTDMQFDTGEGTLDLSADLYFSTFKLTTEVVKRLDLLAAGIEFGAGVDLVQGRIGPVVDVSFPGHQSEVDAAEAALHLDGLTWSTFAVHTCVQLEIGPPFLRLTVQGALMLPLSESSGWWAIRSGRLSGSIGLVIRF